MKKISLLGSTGSIGQSTLQVVRHLRGQFKLTALAAWGNIELLEEQIKEFNPQIVAVFDEAKAHELQKRVPSIKIFSGVEGIKRAAEEKSSDLVISAISGSFGLLPTIAALQAKKQVALANKEALVSGGALVMKLAKENSLPILPIDSEHSAIFQCLNGENKKQIRRIILTASGGPFLKYSMDKLQSITVDQALNHPTWKMGPKVTIDSSTLMNKGLEVIEAHHLFDVPVEKIEVVIHPESIIHSMVEFEDGSMMAQMSQPTMLVPIQYAMTYPERLPGLLTPFDFRKHNSLHFFEPDFERFRCLKLAYLAIKEGGTLPCYMNAVNEVLVSRFLKGEFPWVKIAEHLESLMMQHKLEQVTSLEQLIDVDSMARIKALTF